MKREGPFGSLNRENEWNPFFKSSYESSGKNDGIKSTIMLMTIRKRFFLGN